MDLLTIIGRGFTHEECISIHVRDKECTIDSITPLADGDWIIKCRVNATMVGTNAERSPDPMSIGHQNEVEVRSESLTLHEVNKCL